MPLDIVRLEGRAGIARFSHALPRMHPPGSHPLWAPPLPYLERDVLAPDHPFWRDADRSLFLAVRDGRPAARVAAIENRAHNRRHGDRTGFFGFFEATDDPEAVTAVMDAGGAWLRDRGLATMRGPVSPSQNYESGCLVEGFDRPNRVLTPWNPPFYPTLLEGAGLEGVQDLVGTWIPTSADFPPWFRRAAGRARNDPRIEVVDGDPSRFEAQADTVLRLYNQAWRDTWGFVPLTREEFLRLARPARWLLDPDGAFFVHAHGEPVAFILTVPDFHLLLRGARWRRWLPLALLRMRLQRRRLPDWRVMLLGLTEAYRGGSLLPLLIDEIHRRARDAGKAGAEASWLVEGGLMHRALRRIGLADSKRWRIYEAPLVPEPGAGAGAPRAQPGRE